MVTTVKHTIRFSAGEFDPAVLTYLIGTKVFITVEDQSANGNKVVRRCVTGVLAGAERSQQFEHPNEPSSWPRIYFEHGFHLLVRLDFPDSVVTVSIT
ncbi:hypothetical protein [Microbacterium sp. NPDC056052]|uniref:hypothetical protein n=1 Tax=Microbacterium sp. NPDC056052 TaxID=3345695 RepID=UPI0035DA7BB0